MAYTDANITADASGSLLGAINITVDNQTHAGILGGAKVSAGGAAISGTEPASVLIEAIDTTNIVAASDSTALSTFDFSALTSSVTLIRDTQAYVQDRPGSGMTLATTGLAKLHAENQGNLSGTITSDLLGTVENYATDDSLAFVRDASVQAVGLELRAQSSSSYLASAKEAVNSISGVTQAYVTDSTLTAGTGGVSVSARIRRRPARNRASCPSTSTR